MNKIEFNRCILPQLDLCALLPSQMFPVKGQDGSVTILCPICGQHSLRKARTTREFICRNKHCKSHWFVPELIIGRKTRNHLEWQAAVEAAMNRIVQLNLPIRECKPFRTGAC